MAVKRKLTEPSIQAQLNDTDSITTTLYQHRMTILKTVVESCMNEITREKVNNWESHTFSYFPKCTSGENIFN